MRRFVPAVFAVCVLLCSCGEGPGPTGTSPVSEPNGGEAAAEETGEAKPLATIARILEFQGYSAIAEVESEGDYWEIEAFKDGQRYKLNVDPVDGRILAVTEPSYPVPLSEILTRLGKLGYGPVVKVEIGASDAEEPTPVWEIEMYKGGHAVFLSVDMATGDILSEE